MGDPNERRNVVVGVPQQELAEGDVQIQCIQSSEFVVGKQTNFNGPVTIINCANTSEEGSPAKKTENPNKEKIIIRDKVLSQSTELESKVVFEKKDEENEKQETKTNKRKRGALKLAKIPLLLCLGLALAAVVALALYLVTSEMTDEMTKSNETERHIFYSKADWGGKPPKSIIKMKPPVPYVVVSHSVTSECYHLKACSALIKNMQEYHQSLDFSDIAYNFLVDSSGNIYEGRGWETRNARGGFVNGRNVEVGLIGDFSQSILPTKMLLEGLKYLVDFGVRHGKISPQYTLLPANLTSSTLSPGKNIYQVIQHWQHFDPEPKAHVSRYDE